MNKPYRPALPARGGYVEVQGEYVRVRAEEDTRIEALEQQIADMGRQIEQQNTSLEQYQGTMAALAAGAGFSAFENILGNLEQKEANGNESNPDTN